VTQLLNLTPARFASVAFTPFGEVLVVNPEMDVTQFSVVNGVLSTFQLDADPEPGHTSAASVAFPTASRCWW